MSPTTPRSGRASRAPTPPPSTALTQAMDNPDALMVPVTETNTVGAAQMARTAIEARFIMAMQRPRDWEKVRATILTACRRPRFAEEARYRVPRGDKAIEGLSIRFAEEAARALGNLQVEAHVSFDDAERRIVTVAVTDLEANLTWPFDVTVEKSVERQYVRDGQEIVSHRTTTQNKRVYRVRATDDEVLMKQANLVSKAARNGILRFVPSDVQEEALAVVVATLTTMARDQQTLARMVAAFAKLGVAVDQLEGYLGHPLADITGDEYSKLRGIHEALKEEQTTWDAVIKDVPKMRADRPRPVRADAPQPGANPSTPAQARRRGDRHSAPEVKREEIDLAQKPTPRPLVPDPYNTVPADKVQGREAPPDFEDDDDFPVCEHGVPLDQECVECAALEGHE